MSEGGRLGAPMAARTGEASATTGLRILSAVLALELLWVLLVATAVVFLAAHLGGGSDEITGGPSSRRILLFAVPPATIAVGLALIGARQAIDRRVATSSARLSGTLQLALWLSALANAAVVVTIAISLYHARTTWLVVGLLLAGALTAVAAGCVRAARLN